MVKKVKNKGGRPSKYTTRIAGLICTRLTEGESLRQICSDKKMPGVTTVQRWLADQTYLVFRDQYARAREAQADFIADEILEIADDGSNDYMERKRQDGSTETVLDAEHVQRSRLRIDARKWYASKVAPKKYGDKITQEHTGKDGGPIQLEDATPEKVRKDIDGLFTEPTSR